MRIKYFDQQYKGLARNIETITEHHYDKVANINIIEMYHRLGVRDFTHVVKRQNTCNVCIGNVNKKVSYKELKKMSAISPIHENCKYAIVSYVKRKDPDLLNNGAKKSDDSNWFDQALNNLKQIPGDTKKLTSGVLQSIHQRINDIDGITDVV